MRLFLFDGACAFETCYAECGTCEQEECAASREILAADPVLPYAEVNLPDKSQDLGVVGLGV